jgi:hypothetical protein
VVLRHIATKGITDALTFISISKRVWAARRQQHSCSVAGGVCFAAVCGSPTVPGMLTARGAWIL